MSRTQALTVLFTDLVDSTSLSTSMSPDDADALRRQHFELLRRTLARHEGQEVKNLGDGLMVVFDRPSSALACAVAMQQAVAGAEGPGSGMEAMRIGLAVGEVTSEEADYFGDPVVEAARLCALAENGRILATDLVRAMAGRRAAQEFGEVQELEAKGLPEPIAAVEVKWAPTTKLPTFSPRLRIEPTIGFVGRQRELDALQITLKRVAHGEGPAVVMVAGEPGVGKTTLAAQLAATQERQASILFGHCDEDVGAAYQPFIEALSPVVAEADDEQLRALVDQHGADLGRLFPNLTQRLPDAQVKLGSDPTSDRHLLFESVVGLVSMACAQHPVLLVLDDVQWADGPSLALLRRIAERAFADNLRLMVLCTFRDTEVEFGHELADTVASLRRLPNLTKVELTGLDESAVLDLLEKGAGHDLGDQGRDMARELVQESHGNPYFIRELLFHLADSGMVRVDETGTWVAAESLESLSLPSSVREVVGQRVDRLGEHGRKVLSHAAIIGREFDLNLLERVVDVDPDDVLDVLDAACLGSLLTEVKEFPGRYLFNHALCQATLEGDLSVARRARAHERVATAIEEDPTNFGFGPGAIARQWMQTGRPDHRRKALAQATRAAELALDQLAPTEAARWFQVAVELADQVPDVPDHDRCDLLIGLGTARRQVGADAAEPLTEAFEIARRAGDVERMASAALAQGRGSQSHTGHADDPWRERLQAAIDATAGSHPVLHAQVLAVLASELSFEDRDRRLDLARRALSVAQGVGDPETELQVLNAAYIALRDPALLEERRWWSQRALELAEEIGDPVAITLAALHASYDALDVADMPEVRRLTDRATELAERSGVVHLIWMAALARTLVALIEGDIEVADALSQETFNVGNEGGVPEAMMDFGAHLLTLRRMQGTVAEIVDFVVGALDDYQHMPGMRMASAAVQLDAGNAEIAREIIDREVRLGFDQVPLDSMWVGCLASVGNSVAEMGHEEASRQIYDLMLPFADQVANSIVNTDGSISHTLGGLATVLGKHDDADRHYAQALHVHRDRLESPYLTALTQMAWGRSLLARGADVDRARALLAEALAIAEERGYGKITSLGEAALGAHG